MNFVISHEQTSQSGTNPVILPPDLSDRGRRPGERWGRSRCRATSAALGERLLLPPALQHLCHRLGLSRPEHGHQLRGLSYASPNNSRCREDEAGEELRVFVPVLWCDLGGSRA